MQHEEPASELISVVAPVFNEVDGLAEFHRRVAAVLAGMHYELVLVNDGSTDGSAELLEDLAAADPAVRPVHLSRNFGHQAAVTAGIDASRGAAVVTIDADLQDPPEVIPELVQAWRDGAEVVHAVRHVRPGEPRAAAVGDPRVLPAVRALVRAHGLPGQRRRLPAHGPPGRHRAVVAARAQPLRPRPRVVGRLPAGERHLRARAALRGHVEVPVAQAVRARDRRDPRLLGDPAADRHVRRARLRARRLPRDPRRRRCCGWPTSTACRASPPSTSSCC